PEVLDRVTALSERGLVTMGPRGWGLYELVRDRVRERWPSPDAVERHARWFGRGADALLDGTVGPRLTRAMGELRAAWGRELPPELAGPIGVSMLVVAANHAPRAAALKIADQVLAGELTPALRANAHAMAADIHLFLGHTEQALALVHAGLPFAHDVDRELHLRSLGVRACRIGGRMDEAVAELEQMAPLAARASPLMIAWYHRLAGEVDWLRGDAASAEAHYRKGLPLADPAARSALTSLLATVLRTRGDHDEARRLYDEALSPTVTARNEVVHRFHLAVLERTVGHLDRASALLDRVEHLHRHLGNDTGLLLVQTERALVAEQQGSYDEAEQGLLSLLNGAPLHPSQTWSWTALGLVRIRAGRLAAARHPLDRAAELARAGGLGSVGAGIADLGALLDAADGALDAARATLQATEPTLAGYGPAPLAVHAAVAATIEARWGDPQRAAEHLRRAERLAPPPREPLSEIARWLAFARDPAGRVGE
ncbi:MAG: tetratricopeptide repeat protein, partial [Myxococcota bacterium]